MVARDGNVRSKGWPRFKAADCEVNGEPQTYGRVTGNDGFTFIIKREDLWRNKANDDGK